MKKKYYFIFGFIIIFFLCSCNKKVEIFELSPETENVNQSIVEYYRLQSYGEAEGKFFRAKMLQCAKVGVTQEGYDYTTTVFFYRLAIVPKTTQLMNNFKIQIYPTNGIDVYLQNGGFFEGARAPVPSIKDLNLWLNSYPELHQEEINQLCAFELNASISNIADEWQKKQGISDEEYEKGMTTLRIEINCDGRKDTLLLPFTGELQYITSEDDPLALSNPSIMEILQEGSTHGYFGELNE